jgi:hypothetical protein
MPQKVVLKLYTPHLSFHGYAYYVKNPGEIDPLEDYEYEVYLKPGRIWRIWKKDIEYYVEYELDKDDDERLKNQIVNEVPKDAKFCECEKCGDCYISYKEFTARRIMTFLKRTFGIECQIERVRETLDYFFCKDDDDRICASLKEIAGYVEDDIGKYPSCEFMTEIALLYLHAHDLAISWSDWEGGNRDMIAERFWRFVETKDPNVFRGLWEELW